jgi:hypothetical protein
MNAKLAITARENAVSANAKTFQSVCNNIGGVISAGSYPVREDRCDEAPPSLYKPGKYRVTRCYAYEESGFFDSQKLTDAFIPASEIAPLQG